MQVPSCNLLGDGSCLQQQTQHRCDRMECVRCTGSVEPLCGVLQLKCVDVVLWLQLQQLLQLQRQLQLQLQLQPLLQQLLQQLQL